MEGQVFKNIVQRASYEDNCIIQLPTETNPIHNQH